MPDEAKNALPEALTAGTEAESSPAATEVKDVAEVETAPTTSASAEPASEPTQEPAEPAKSRAQERIEQLAGDNKLLREHNEYLRKFAENVLEERKRTVAAPKAAEPVATAPEVKETPPSLEEAGFDVTKHADMLAKWTSDQVAIRVNKAIEAKQAEQEAKSKEQIIVEAANKFRQTHADFDLLLQGPSLQWTNEIGSALKELGEDSPEVGYYLAKNPDKLAKIARLPAAAQAVAVGRVAAEVLSKPDSAPAAKAAPATSTPAAKRVSQAPPPPEPVSAGHQADIDPMTLHPNEWRKFRNAEVAEYRKNQRGGRAG